MTTSPQLVLADALAPQPWKNGGGHTRELLAWPPGGHWRVRVSRADIASDGPFSAFPGVERWFVVLEGAGVVLHFPDADRRLRVGDAPLQFDGAMAPGCTQIDGATQDLNLMVRNGHGRMAPVQPAAAWAPEGEVNGLYVRVAGHWHCRHADGAQQSLALPAHSLLWTAADPADAAGRQWQFTATEARAEPAIGWWLGYFPAERPARPDPRAHAAHRSTP